MTGPSPLRHRPGLFMPRECRHLIERGALGERSGERVPRSGESPLDTANSF